VSATTLSPAAAGAAIPRGLPVLRGAGRIVVRNLFIYRHTWYLLVAEIFEPVLYLLSVGVGIGELIRPTGGLTQGVPYASYVAPALLATAAMNGAMNETTFAMFTKLRLLRTYDSIMTTPITARHIAVGEALWAILRGTLITCGFLIVVGILGLARSAEIVLVVPGAAIIGFTFSCLGLLVVTWIRNWQDFQFIQLAMLPMFLFATTFYPLSVYPRGIQFVVECLPLYQSIQLVRDPALGHVGPQLLIPLGYLLLLGTVCLWWSTRRIERTLIG
jgi:lipooligosaccharide transport system permease protein